MVCVVLINYNGREDTEACVKSLLENDVDKKIIIVDNNSIKNKAIYNDIITPESCEIIYLDDNLGFAAGNNVGIKKALEYNPDYILLLNNDTVVPSNCLEKMIIKEKEYADNVVITTKISYFDEPDYLWYGGSFYNSKEGEYKILGIGKKDDDSYNEEKPVDYITGCVMFIPVSLLTKIGYMSEDYFLYFEDADYCQQIKQNNVDMVYVPSITVLHKESRSTNRGSDLYNYYIIRNYLKYISQYSDRKMHYIIRKFFLTIKEVLRGRLSFKIWKSAWKDFLIGKYGKKEFV